MGMIAPFLVVTKLPLCHSHVQGCASWAMDSRRRTFTHPCHHVPERIIHAALASPNCLSRTLMTKAVCKAYDSPRLPSPDRRGVDFLRGRRSSRKGSLRSLEDVPYGARAQDRDREGERRDAVRHRDDWSTSMQFVDDGSTTVYDLGELIFDLELGASFENFVHFIAPLGETQSRLLRETMHSCTGSRWPSPPGAAASLAKDAGHQQLGSGLRGMGTQRRSK